MEANRKPRRSTTGAARVNVIHNFQSLCGGPGLMNDWHRTSLAISSSLDPGLGVLDVTYAKASYKVLCGRCTFIRHRRGIHSDHAR
jgi:hypothetical protein